ncbi:MAG TPA: substrate-binding domain-containing protein [Clostridia bacterium]|jgi:ribose transport system substrate-binding protein|nr:substrate-binding domain-containing protein [Clostridia bacterium]HPY42863.1 substrate-binding domain-containing protein [Clostridia bacterium]HQA97293.1 substrate-binding domain-containing protein [Clostridia bacterium]HQO56848.1 substrate-binding domain-containing protein [Clostridia bacterium]HUM61533.1 substrate-binding domain-containing protein [Clostridia bacterium]
MKKLVTLLLAAIMLLSVTSALAANEDIVILVPNADHGWTGAVLSYAEEKAKEINDAGVYTARVIASSDPANQITQVEDIIDNKSAKTVVILPYDNTLEATMRKLVDSGIPFVMFDRVIDAVAENAVSVVKGDNEGIGLETAKRFVAVGLLPGEPVLIIPGDNSSVPEMRNNGFFKGLLEAGWTQEQVDGIKSTAYTGWSRSEGRRLFTEWLDSNTIDEIKANRYIFTHDDEIAMGMLEALKSSDIDPAKKEAFLGAKVILGSSSGLNEIYSVLKGIHQKDYTAEVAQLGDLFTVTYDPGMIKIAVQDMVDYLDGKEVAKDHVVPVSVVDATNVSEFQGFGDAFAK